MKIIICILTAVCSAYCFCFGEVTRETQWQDVPSDTLVGTVVDLGQGGGGSMTTNIVENISANQITNSVLAGYLAQPSITNGLCTVEAAQGMANATYVSATNAAAVDAKAKYLGKSDTAMKAYELGDSPLSPSSRLSIQGGLPPGTPWYWAIKDDIHSNHEPIASTNDIGRIAYTKGETDDGFVAKSVENEVNRGFALYEEENQYSFFAYYEDTGKWHLYGEADDAWDIKKDNEYALEYENGEWFFQNYSIPSTVHLDNSLNDYIVLGRNLTAATNALASRISATDPTFSNAVLSVGLNVPTNIVASINFMATNETLVAALGELANNPPIDTTTGATTVGGLLAALAAAVAWLKKNKASILTAEEKAKGNDLTIGDIAGHLGWEDGNV